MRKTGKRTLAGIAAGALGLALIPFVGAGVSQAAITGSGVLAPQAGDNYVVTAGAPFATAIRVQAGAEVTLRLAVNGNETNNNQTAIFALGGVLVGDDLTVGAVGDGWVQTTGATITYTEDGTDAQVTNTATFDAPDAAGAGTLVITGTGAGAVTPVAIQIVPDVSDVTFTAPTASRAGTPTTFQTNFTTGVDDEGLCVAAVTTPPGATFAPAGTGRQAAAGDQEDVALTILGSSISVPGTYPLVFYGRSSDAPADLTCPAPGNTPTLATATLVVGGAVASVQVSPATTSTAPAADATFAVSARDAQNRPTLFGAANSGTAAFGADVYSLASDSATTTFSGSATVFNQSSSTFTAQNSVAGTATITLTPNNDTVTAATAQLVTVQAGTAAAVVLSSPDSVVAGGNRGVPVGTSSLTFTISGAATEVGKQFRYSVTATGGAATAVSNALTEPAVAGPQNNAIAQVTVPVTSSLLGNTVTLTPAGVAGVTAQMVARAMDVDAFTPGAVVGKRGGPVTISGTVVDQFGAPVPSASVTGAVTGSNTTATVPTVTNASGEFTTTYTAAATGTGTDTVTFTIVQPAYGANITPTTTVTFNATGSATVTALQMGTGNVTPAAFVGNVNVPFTGTLATDATGTSTTNDANRVRLNAVTDVAGVQVTYTATGGFVTDDATERWDRGETSITVAQGTSVYFFATETGSATVEVTAGGNSLSGSVNFVSPPQAARNIVISATPERVKTGATSSATISVTDVFGNPTSLGAAIGTGDNSSVTLQTTLGTLAGGSSVFTVNSLNSLGQATVTLTSQVEGSATISAAGAGGQFANTAGDPFGAPAPIRTATTSVQFGAGEQSIVLTGDRQGRSIVVVGETTGLAGGTVVRPWIRFPGQTSYNRGDAQPRVEIIDPQNEAGEFVWQRRTGKRTAVIFRTNDESVSSSRIIIPAR